MTKRYPGGYITKTAPTVSTTSAPGIWTMEQQAAYQKAGTWPFGGPFNYIEDVFSTYLYTGNDSARVIDNGIDLAGKGGLVWIKVRGSAGNHILTDTARGVRSYLRSNTTDAQVTPSATFGVTSFESNGFGLDQSIGSLLTNTTGQNYASWTFRKQPKFFDVVTWTGDSVAGRQIQHSLGVTPGCIIVKRTDNIGEWVVWHRGLTDTFRIVLNTTAAQTSANFQNYFGDGANYVAPTSTNFTLGTNASVNASGATYVAYLFAHNAGGFGLTGTDNVISCGSYVGNGVDVGPTVTLGWEPQWLLVKAASDTGNWALVDAMRGFTVNGVNITNPTLLANSSAAENTGSLFVANPSATGFNVVGSNAISNASGVTYIYIAIRRGPMKTPTSGTSVFAADTYSGNDAAPRNISTGFVVDAAFTSTRQSYNGFITGTRLMGKGLYLETAYTTAASTNNDTYYGFDSNTNEILGASALVNSSAYTYINYAFRRAPSFFDVVCDSTGGPTIYHNLGVAPELIIAKVRNYSPQDWFVDVPALGSTRTLNLNTTGAASSTNYISSPTASQFTTTLGGGGYNYVYYLFASCPGVSKVGSYSGTGATQTISCGFAARFVLIKRTDSTGDWFVWDTARGMVAGTDPRLALNSTAAETNANWVYTDAAGFQIVTTDATVNASGGSYIYLAIS